MVRPPSTEVPSHVEAPLLEDARPFCPRCRAPLRFDGEDLFCVACGYEYAVTPAIRRAITGRIRRPAAAALAPLAWAVRSFPGPAGLAVIAGCALLAVAFALTRRGLSRRSLTRRSPFQPGVRR
ncbi:MAG: hypothetical protein WC273_09340 [Dehalococcoidia bacterium]